MREDYSSCLISEVEMHARGGLCPYTGFNCSKVHKLGRIIPHSEKHPKNAHFSLRILLTIIGSVDSEEVSLPHVQLFRCSAFAGRSVVIHGLHVEVLCIEQL